MRASVVKIAAGIGMAGLAALASGCCCQNGGETAAMATPSDVHVPSGFSGGENNTPAAGYTALFNGKDLTHWHALGLDPGEARDKRPWEIVAAQAANDATFRDHWKVVNGVIEYDGHSRSLQTIQSFKNFDLWVDWKIEADNPKADSGIYLRGSPQVQIWVDKVGSGGLYNNEKHPKDPLVVADNPPGQWNRFHIVMEGEKVTVWLNGKLVVDHVVMENYWDRSIPIFPSGPIELQHHWSKLWFRNIFVKELP